MDGGWPCAHDTHRTMARSSKRRKLLQSDESGLAAWWCLTGSSARRIAGRLQLNCRAAVANNTPKPHTSVHAAAVARAVLLSLVWDLDRCACAATAEPAHPQYFRSQTTPSTPAADCNAAVLPLSPLPAASGPATQRKGKDLLFTFLTTRCSK